jgi:serine/threonine protein phosphatase PrpC
VSAIQAAALTHRGRVRPGNEDTIGLAGWLSAESGTHPVALHWTADGPALCVIADGMGGHAAGEVASRLAVERLLAATTGVTDEAGLRAAILQAHLAVRAAARADPAKADMGTTLAGLLILDGQALVFNIGDSRVYRENSSYLRLLSCDDTSSFDSDGPEARTGRRSSHGLLQALGLDLGGTAPSPHLSAVKIGGGERFLLCSDGLTDMLDQDEIEACLEPDLAATVTRLFKAAMAAGGEDNISIMMVQCPRAASVRAPDRPSL